MKIVNTLKVMYNGREVGLLRKAPDGRRCTFQYTGPWLSEGFSISPLKLPLKDEIFIAPQDPFDGNFGVFEDSLPDGYGRYLLNRMLRREGIVERLLDPIQRLSIVGRSGMGALEYLPESYVGEEKSLPSLDVLQDMALDVLSEKTDKDADILYFNSGNSGGCRPKCLMKDGEGDWLVKFRHTYDLVEIGRNEYDCNVLARNAGIDVPDFKLIEGKYFATKRFDIKDAKRLHVITASGLLDTSIRVPSLDYVDLLKLTGFITQDPRQVEQMYRRMVFNVLIENKDDHAKNFSFLCDDGTWSLAPAFDLTRFPTGYNGEHATSVCGNGRPREKDLLEAAESIRIPSSRAREIYAEVHGAVRGVKLS